ncbi:MAG: DNA polymerase III subunit gamma/tau [Eubacterium sp.]|nr:DNA polymerase III subunit gamma/tau [Eubacterium sp.]
MSYVALYRKFRPDSFDEVKGQDHIVTTIKNQIRAGRVGHAYLFCGTRGTGKTTMAKLLAKTVNCEHPTENGPCGECPSCKAIADGTSLNVIEIDAASNNGVENVRQINESVQYSPATGKYIVYIVDEVHMLSASAYNALLKTLEEPPEYVIFILATTDDQKLPVTIKSRCQRYDFHRISLDTITDRLEEIVNREGGKADREALKFIARTADGSMRDALSILDECMSATLDETLTKDGVLKTIGAVSVDIYMDMMKAIEEDDAAKILSIIKEAIYNGKDLTKFVDDFTWFMRNVLFLKLSPGIKSEIDMTEENADELIKLGERFSEETLTRYLTILQELASKIRYSSIKQITLEMDMIRMMRPETENDFNAIIGRIERLESGAESEKPAPAAETPAEAVPPRTPATTVEAAPPEAAPTAPAISEKEIEELIDKKISDKLSSGDFMVSEPFDKKKQSDIVLQNIREQYEPATAEDVIELAKMWQTEIVPRLTNFHRFYGEQISVEPAPDYKDEGTAKLNIVFDEKMAETDVRYDYYMGENTRSELADQVSRLIGRKVEFNVVLRKGTKGVLDKKSFAFEKINFDNIKQIDHE